MLKIGFTEKYFTLWEVSEPYLKYVNEFEAYEKIDYCFIQNLSLQKDKAIEKAKSMNCETSEVDYDLKGQKSWCWTSPLKFIGEEYQFPYGKLLGQDIRTCNDTWQLNRISNNKYARLRLLELGYVEVENIDGILVIVTPEESQNIKESIDYRKNIEIEFNQTLEHIKTGIIENYT